MEKRNFKHTIEVVVRNYEVDWQGIVHNANYLLYFEVGRIEYFKHLGIAIDASSIRGNSRIVLVRNEIDYRSPARFDDQLKIYTRISYIKDSSFAFESFMEMSDGSRILAENIAIHVWLNPRNGEPSRVPDDFRRIVQRFEGNDVAILGPTLYT